MNSLQNKWMRWLAGLALLLVGPVARVSAGELIINGNFETGDLSGWTTASQAGGSSSFLAASGTTAPLSGQKTVGPAGGTYYALSDQDPKQASWPAGSAALYQAFTVAGPVKSVTLSFDMFVNDWSGRGPILGDGSLDYHSGNLFARVDILNGITDPLGTGSGQVVKNYYKGVDPATKNPNAYTHYTFDITTSVQAGGTFYLRFGEVSSQGILNVGVDNVSVALDPGVNAVPEPSSLLLLGLGGAGLFVIRHRRAGRAGQRVRGRVHDRR